MMQWIWFMVNFMSSKPNVIVRHEKCKYLKSHYRKNTHCQTPTHTHTFTFITQMWRMKPRMNHQLARVWKNKYMRCYLHRLHKHQLHAWLVWFCFWFGTQAWCSTRNFLCINGNWYRNFSSSPSSFGSGNMFRFNFDKKWASLFNPFNGRKNSIWSTE